LNELVAHRLHFEGYKYDRLIGKLVKIPINVFQKSSHVQAIIVATSYRNELVVTITEEYEPIRRGVELAIVSCSRSLGKTCHPKNHTISYTIDWNRHKG
jgi:hypothetical protein